MDKWLLVAMSALVMSGCSAMGGDMIIRVSGALPATTDMAGREDACQLHMVFAETGEHLNAREIRGEFSTTMMVVSAPAPTHYFFVADCTDGRSFNSRTISISSRRSHSRTFDLGTLGESQ
ncbi:hypothetical protein [Stenotrophomonas beteli]|uniref:Lipoprotein n=1 Tax=Stenotrophomonas beteli TaxID=3384461 RepID=A0A0R0ATG6_9GAMM|nr:hypothetical protein [Stenotrophomonas maltophilia]KRG48443.1 hypothetical protein ARC23_16530 [Stenotrophomonas maltophilia]